MRSFLACAFLLLIGGAVGCDCDNGPYMAPTSGATGDEPAGR